MNPKTTLNSLILLLFLIVLSSSCISNNDSSLANQDRQAIAEILDSYATGWNSENPEKMILSLFTHNAVLLPHHGAPQVKGKDNIRKHFWPAGVTGFK